MGVESAIEWTDATWNPVTGCRKISPGCDNCYAAALARRLKAMGNPRYQNDGPDGPGFGLTLHHDKLTEPSTWKSSRMIFVNSMSDLFHPGVPAEFVLQVFQTIVQTPRHQYQILTKRPRRMARILTDVFEELGGIPSNAWLGTSIESDRWVWRANWVRQTPAVIRFLSLEPLLGPVPSLDLTGIDWVIVGGESGHGRRPIEASWVRAIRDRCERSRVSFFFKQWGGVTSKSLGRVLDGRTWDDLPAARPHLRGVLPLEV